MSSETIADHVLDASGLLCPLPVVRARQAMDGLSQGQVLQIIATDPGSKTDIPAWARTSRHTLLEATAEGGQFIFHVQKG